jgi:hypothetical protein
MGWHGYGYGGQPGYGDYSPNWYYQDRQQQYRSGDRGSYDYDRDRRYNSQSQYDNDWRSGPNDDNRGQSSYDNRGQSSYDNRSYDNRSSGYDQNRYDDGSQQ